MKLSHYLSILLVSSLAFSGCDSSSSSDEVAADTTTVSGMTTLSKGFVCVDENKDFTCNTSETKVQTGEQGDYKLVYDGTLEEGAQLVAEDGLNLVLDENNLNRLAFSAKYYSADSEHNINTMTTLISQRVSNGASYADAKAGIAQKYDISESLITEDPLALIEDEDGKKLFLTIRGMEFGFTESLKENVQNSKQRAVDTNTTNSVISEDEADSALNQVSDYLSYNVNQYLYKLENYFLDLKNYALNYIVNLKDDIIDGCYWDDNCSVDVNLPREALNGAWYMWGLHACIEIDPQDNLLMRTVDKNESYTLYYRDYNSDFTLLKGWVEQGLVKIVKDANFYKEGNKFNYLKISYDIKEGDLELDNNSTEAYTMIRSSSLDSCYSILSKFN